MDWWEWALIGYASVLAAAAVIAVLSRRLMRSAAEPLPGDPAIAAPLLPDVASGDSMIGGKVAA